MDEEFEMYLKALKELGLHLECSYGCSSYHYVCNGVPEDNPCCPSSVVVDENGEEIPDEQVRRMIEERRESAEP